MKKDRNTFFAESSMMNSNNFAMPNMNVANAPYPSASYANSSFYAGPMMPQTPGMYNNFDTQNNSNNNSELEARLSKIERLINRLDHRLTKLENLNLYSSEDIESTNNVYML